MWYDDFPLNTPWTSLWSGYILCACSGIRKFAEPCTVCGAPPPDTSPQLIVGPNGNHMEIPVSFAGAEGRIEDYEFLAVMEREWKRPLSPPNEIQFSSGMSERCALVLLFWTYFETRMYRLVTLGLRTLPPPIQNDLLNRYDSVSSHMRPLYQILFGVKYLDDLKAVGKEHIGGHLSRVQDCRNRFVHGDPKAISGNLVEAVVSMLKEEHEAWIAVFNYRIACSRGSPSPP